VGELTHLDESRVATPSVCVDRNDAAATLFSLLSRRCPLSPNLDGIDSFPLMAAAVHSTYGDFIVRRAVAGDVESVIELYLGLGEEGWFIAPESPVDRHERRLLLQQRLQEPQNLVLVAVVSDQVVGYLTVVAGEREAAEIALGVASEWRSRGIGTRLVKGAVAWGRERRIHKLSVKVFVHNESTLRLFDNVGFEREGCLRAHYQRRDGALWDVVMLGLRPTAVPERP
jgi:RimJ/RimL family protein N-acetyltransferase